MGVLGKGTIFVDYTSQVCKEYIPHTDNFQNSMSKLPFPLSDMFF